MDTTDNNIIIGNYKKMSRKELEEFADRMRIERNTLILEEENGLRKTY